VPLVDGYGVVIYHCAIDVDSKMTNDGIEWRVIPLTATDLKGVAAMSNGWHSLASTDASGALDNIRTGAFHRPGCTIFFVRFDPFLEALRRWFNLQTNPPWSSGSSIAALTVFEPLLADVKRIFIYGEPFTYGGLGVHNIHQNQGDPSGSQWWGENAIWQDGGTIIQRNNDSYVAFLTKFNTQANQTDGSGHPVP
jgi:uncharacterized protein DUF2278